MKTEELANMLNELVAEGKGECVIGVMVTKPSPAPGHPPYIDDYQITQVYDEAIETGCISIVAKEWPPLPPSPPTDGMMLI